MKRIKKPSHGSQRWLELRWRDEQGRCVFGASDAPALANSSPYMNRADLFFNKRTKPIAGKETEAFRRGNLLEPVLIQEASRLLQTDIFTPNFMYQRERFTISLDGVNDDVAPSLIVEAKTTAKYRVKDQEDLPREWLWQGWAQQFTTKAEVFFMVLDADLQFSLIELPRNEEAEQFLFEESEWLGSLIDEQAEPDEALLSDMSAEQIGKLWTSKPSAIELPNEAAEWLQLLEQAKDDLAYAKKQEERAKDELARLLMGHEIGLLGGRQVVSWKLTKGRKSLDQASLKQDFPDIFKHYEKEGEPYRTMRVTRTKK